MFPLPTMQKETESHVEEYNTLSLPSADIAYGLFKKNFVKRVDKEIQNIGSAITAQANMGEDAVLYMHSEDWSATLRNEIVKILSRTGYSVSNTGTGALLIIWGERRR